MFHWIIIIPSAILLVIFVKIIRDIRNGVGEPQTDFEQLEKWERRRQRGQARAAEYSQRYNGILQEKWAQEEAEAEQRSIERQRRKDAELGWGDGRWVWDQR